MSLQHGKRYSILRGENREWMVIDSFNQSVVCKCAGFSAPLTADYVCAALEAYHTHLYEKFKDGPEKANGNGQG